MRGKDRQWTGKIGGRTEEDKGKTIRGRKT